LHHELDPGGPGERYQVVVHVDASVLADPDQPGQSVLEGGTRVPAETSRRLACDARGPSRRRTDLQSTGASLCWTRQEPRRPVPHPTRRPAMATLTTGP